MNIFKGLKKIITLPPSVTRPKIGLALGSGGARGLAHIGVIKILEENNIPIDYISGASIGAVIGGFYSATRDINSIEKLATSTDWRKFVSLLDPSFKTGIFRGDKAKKFLEEYTQKKSFSQLQIPFSVVATDYKTGEAKIISSGDVASAIRASMSVPIAFNPSDHEENILVDGGLSIPVPVDIVRKMGADIIIAVNLDGDYFSYSHEKDLRFHKIALNSINLLRHHLARENIKNADIIITPKVGNILWYEFVTGKKAILAGENATREKITELKKIVKNKTAH